jgi:hypothetical protein
MILCASIQTFIKIISLLSYICTNSLYLLSFFFEAKCTSFEVHSEFKAFISEGKKRVKVVSFHAFAVPHFWGNCSARHPKEELAFTGWQCKLTGES